ncbi:MAG TPA: hypothetical protein PLD27_05415 [bacterium]|nr:hypothetical protein [bacterium]HOL47269.1 hypothetical protein [bacterium]HPQ19634.1 hypothetical protein [bacterium]
MKILNILFYPKYTALSFLRALTPFRFLQKFDCFTEFYDYLDLSKYFSLKLFEKSNIIILNRNIPNFISSLIINFCRQNNKTIFYEIDDLLFALPKYHPFSFFYNNYKIYLSQILKSVDGIIVSTELLKKFLSKYNQNIFVYENLLPTEIISISEKLNGNDTLTIGYSGSLTHYKDFIKVYIVWKLLYQKYKDKIKFRIIGPLKILKKNSDLKNHNIFSPQLIESSNFDLPIEYINGSDNYLEFMEIFANNRFDIGFCPLIDNDFNRCKSHIKYLEYSIFNVYGLYSELEPYNNINNNFIDKIKGLNVYDWFNKTTEIINDYENKKKQITKIKKYVYEEYNIENKIQLILDLKNWLIKTKSTNNFKLSLFDKDLIILIWGLSNYGFYCYNILNEFGYKKIIFIDSNIEQIKKYCDKYKVYHSSELTKLSFDIIIIASFTYFSEIYKQIINTDSSFEKKIFL